MATLLSVNIGMPQDVAWRGETVHTGIWKSAVAGRRLVRRLNVDGDGQGDTNGHGGENRAVLVYQIQAYRHWRDHFGRDDFAFGQFGENFTVDGLPDDEVCIGDRYRIGEAEFEVSQPRVTCFRVGMRLGEPGMPSLLVAHHRPGFYLRVLTEGHVQAGDEILKTGTGPGALSVADTDALLYLPDRDPERLRTALRIPALSPGWQGSFRQLLRGEEHGQPPAGAEPGWAGFRGLRVVGVVVESSQVASIQLAARDEGPLPAARPGQYLTLRVGGAGQPAPVRSYSLSSAPGADTYRISVKREPEGLVSGYLHTKLRPGAVLDAAAPRGDFVLRDGTNPVLLVSAGIGVTPVLAMLHRLAAAGSERDVWWLHVARDPAGHALAGEAHRLLASLAHGRERVFYTAATLAELARTGAMPGRLTADNLAALDLPADASAYLCGPAGFMADVRGWLGGLGLAPADIHSELFGALDAINPGLVGQRRVAPHPPPGRQGTGPLVTFARSGLTVPFGGGTLLELAEACDVPTRWSCRTGVCHTCVTPVLAGEVSYSPAPLELPATGSALPCCASPLGELVLDM
jgi:ferredoxin-NADP reductase/MOSC domain-containing protein YiiM